MSCDRKNNTVTTHSLGHNLQSILEESEAATETQSRILAVKGLHSEQVHKDSETWLLKPKVDFPYKKGAAPRKMHCGPE